MLMMVNIYASTGWVLPSGDLKRVMDKQLFEILTEKYSNMNFAEIELAFRTLGPNVQEFGKPFNIALLSRVLDLYLENRKIVSDMEQSRQKPPELALPIMTDDERQVHLEEMKHAYLVGRLSLRMLPIDCYTYAIRIGLLAPTREEKWEAYIQAGNILNPDGITQVLHDTAEMLSKQILLSKYFNK